MNTKTIAALLHMTEAKVHEVHATAYFQWCVKYANEFGYNAQSLIANTAISKWFNEQWQEKELEAYETLYPTYGKMTADRARMIYGAITSDVYKNFPKTLFEAAVKLNINGDHEKLNIKNPAHAHLCN